MDAFGNWTPEPQPPTPNNPPFIYPSAPDYIDYPGPPVDKPPKLQHVVCDINGQQWQYVDASGAWQ